MATGSVLDVCLRLGCGGVGGDGGEFVGSLDQRLEGRCGVMSVLVWIVCVDGRSWYLYIVLGGYMRILGTPSVQSGCTFSISTSYRVLVCVRYRKSRHVLVWLSDLELSRNRLLL